MIERPGQKLPLVGTILLIASALVGVAAFSQTAAPAPARKAASTFQVATIKPSRQDESMAIQIRGRRFATTGTSLIDVIKYCYGVHASQIVDGPEWMRTKKFDLLADPDTEDRPASDEMKRMVQELLADRFHLVFRRAKRELPVYAIVIAKNGPRLTRSESDTNGIPVAGYTPGRLGVGNASMVDLATFLQRYVTDRPVVDRTGVMGKYDLSLHWTPDDSQPNRMVAQTKEEADVLPGLYTAIQEQLGLKLQPMKAPTGVLVVDHVELPSED